MIKKTTIVYCHCHHHYSWFGLDQNVREKKKNSMINILLLCNVVFFHKAKKQNSNDTGLFFFFVRCLIWLGLALLSYHFRYEKNEVFFPVTIRLW